MARPRIAVGGARIVARHLAQALATRAALSPIERTLEPYYQRAYYNRLKADSDAIGVLFALARAIRRRRIRRSQSDLRRCSRGSQRRIRPKTGTEKAAGEADEHAFQCGAPRASRSRFAGRAWPRVQMQLASWTHFGDVEGVARPPVAAVARSIGAKGCTMIKANRIVVFVVLLGLESCGNDAHNPTRDVSDASAEAPDSDSATAAETSPATDTTRGYQRSRILERPVRRTR